MQTHSFVIVTTDVQSVSICRVSGTTYSVQCGYVMGSDARGCVYVIMGDDVMGNVTGTIARGNSGGETVDLADPSCFSEVLAYDWESDNTTGTLPIRRQVNSSITGSCPSTLTPATDDISKYHYALMSLSSLSLYYMVHLSGDPANVLSTAFVIIICVASCVLVIVLFIGVLIIVTVICRKSK